MIALHSRRPSIDPRFPDTSSPAAIATTPPSQAGASIVAVLRCLPPEVPPGLDPTASKDFMAPVVNLSALLAQVRDVRSSSLLTALFSVSVRLSATQPPLPSPFPCLPNPTPSPRLQSVILLRLALAWSPRGVALGRLEGDDSELWEVVTRGILQAERDRGCAGMCRGILQAVSRLLALGKAAIGERPPLDKHGTPACIGTDGHSHVRARCSG